MLPAHLAENICKQVLFYLQSTFDFRDKSVEDAFNRFMADSERVPFNGTCVQRLASCSRKLRGGVS